MTRLPLIGLLAASVMFVIDQAAKYWITDIFNLGLSDVRKVTSFFQFTFLPNKGVSLGLFPAGSDGTRWALVAVTGAIALGVLVWMSRERNRIDQIALGAILGGAAGNILDRVRLGYVVDFLDLHFGEWRPFLIFNTADAAITIGVLVLLVRAMLVRDKGGALPVQLENGNA